MDRQVRIVGNPDLWDVVCETPSTIVLRNPTAKLREQIAKAESQLGELRAQLEARTTETPHIGRRTHGYLARILC